MNNIFQYLRDNPDVKMTIQADDNAFAGRKGYTIILKKPKYKKIGLAFAALEPHIPGHVHVYLIEKIRREWGR